MRVEWVVSGLTDYVLCLSHYLLSVLCMYKSQLFFFRGICLQVITIIEIGKVLSSAMLIPLTAEQQNLAHSYIEHLSADFHL